MPLSASNASPPVPEPRKLRVIDLFAFVTVAAVILAIAAPYLRGMKPEQAGKLLALTSVQLALAVAVFVYATHKRRQVTQPLGKSFGIAYSGLLRGRNLSQTLSILQMLAAASCQLLLALLFIRSPDDMPINWFMMYLLYQVQLGLLAGYTVARFTWRVYPNAVEFYDSGVVFNGTLFLPWAQIDVRENRYSSQSLNLVIRQDVHSPAAETKPVQVPADLQPLIFQAAANATSASQPGDR